MSDQRDHGGNLDAAILRHGGSRADWADLSTGINPVPYPLPALPPEAWTALPDRAAHDALIAAARAVWNVPESRAILPVPGASSAIAHIPALAPAGRVHIPGPTYNEHAAAFARLGWQVDAVAAPGQSATVLVHPNNPTGAFHDTLPTSPLTVLDESFCDVAPDRSHVVSAPDTTLILKSFGKFWGLAGLRLGFVIGAPERLARLSDMLGPWPVSGPALHIGAQALSDTAWAEATRARLTADAAHLDTLMTRHGATLTGGTPLFRLYTVPDAAALQTRLARHHIWTRIFPYSPTWIRLGLPAPDRWAQIEAALA